LKKWFCIIITASISFSYAAQNNYSRDSLKVKVSEVWTKLYEFIDLSDWDRLTDMNPEVREVLIENCEGQLDLFKAYQESIIQKNQKLAKKNLTLLIANGVTLHLKVVLNDSDLNKRKARLKGLFGELVAIQYPLKEADFEYYKSLYLLIRTLYSSSAASVEMNRKLVANHYYQKILKTC